MSDEPSEDINKADSGYFALLPAEFYAKMRGVANSHFWPIELKDNATQPLLTGAVKDVYSKMLGRAYLKGELLAEQYLWQVACIDTWDTEDLPDTVRHKIIPFNATRMSRIYDKLATPKIEDVQSSMLADILRSSRSDLLDRHAVMQFEEGIVDIIYIKDAEERHDFIGEFLDNCKSLDIRGVEDIDEDGYAGMISNKGHVVLITSLLLADDFAHANSSNTLAKIIEHYNWPFVIVRGVDSGHITLYYGRSSEDTPQLFEDA